ncbi:hypothetical protein TARUN_1230 [Trichoderma arundinaceum]|uniref:Uncharacterized protein n=1 Tax=Trichoderma arundinaceum TaxID=490622 RepID=A0A395NXY7_TRIAR|nr:hypothetical protein TARUN_1230 [Trichoderma arundinaceum]
MAPQDKKWDDSAERDLCVAIILGNQELAKGRHNWPRISEIMTSLGYSFTKDAMSYVDYPPQSPLSPANLHRTPKANKPILQQKNSQHFSKTILKEFRARHSADATLESSPLSARKTKAAGKAATPAKKRARKIALEPALSKTFVSPEDEDDDLDVDSTPSKRPKKENANGLRLKKEEISTQSTVADNEEAFRAWSAQRSSTAESHPFD